MALPDVQVVSIRLARVTFVTRRAGSQGGSRCDRPSRDRTLGPEHVMASGSLPPGFPPTVIAGTTIGTTRWYRIRRYGTSSRL